MNMTTEMQSPLTLNKNSLRRLPENILVPSYDRTKLRPGIVHVGVGNFHRAHQSWYLHRLFQEGIDHDWAIVGAGIRDYDITQRNKLVHQDYLTTLVELAPDSNCVEIVGSMIDYVPIKVGNAPLIERLADPSTRIVSLTVTESGYFVNPATQSFDSFHSDIVHDANNIDTPRTVFGVIIAALYKRRTNGVGPFTIQSCDNLIGNGDVTKNTVLQLARLSNPNHADWIEAHCTFPNSMVDCIVPATSASEIELVRSLGIDDAVPVTHENFRQWVMEDTFCAGRPEWEKIGVTFTDNVHGYEMQKIRILNAGHQILANIGELMNIKTVAGAMANPDLRDFFMKVQREEIVPNVVPVPGVKPGEYVDLIATRFANPSIADTIRRIAYDGATRHSGMVHPSIRAAIDNNTPFKGLALVEAAWAKMCGGVRNDGSAIEPNDPNWDTLTQVARAAVIEPRVWLEQRQIYADLADNAEFVDIFTHWLNRIEQSGITAALSEFLGRSSPQY